MFCVLNIEKKKLTFFEKVFRFTAHDDYIIKTVPVFKGAPFYILNIYVCDTVNWEQITKYAGKCARRLIVSDNITVPEIKEIGIYKSEKLYNKVFQNTLLQIFGNNKLNKHPMHIAVCDKSGEHTNFVEYLAKYASKLSVVTENKEKYISACEKILENTGLCISVLSDFDDAKIKINLDKNIMSISLENMILNISNGENIEVDEIYKKLLPEGINSHDFYSALYELCGVFSLGECVFGTVTVNNEKKQIKDIQFA